MDHVPSYEYNDMFTKSHLRQHLKKALHVTKTGDYQKKDDALGHYIKDRNENTAWLYSDLLQRGLRILINVGEFDLTDGVRQTLEWTKQIKLSDRSDFDW